MKAALVVVLVCTSSALSVSLAYLAVSQRACQICLAGWAEDIQVIPLEPRCRPGDTDGVVSAYIGR